MRPVRFKNNNTYKTVEDLHNPFDKNEYFKILISSTMTAVSTTAYRILEYVSNRSDKR